MKYVALLRGINVGGKNTVQMVKLRECLEQLGLKHVQTYINSGNVIFESSDAESDLTSRIETAIEKTFGFAVPTVVISKDSLEKVVLNAPEYWLERDDWKYNYIFLMKPYDMEEVISGVGELKPGIELITPGAGMLYQAMSMKLFGRTTTGKLASKPVYKQMTIRNHNTLTKLVEKLSS